MSFPSRRSVLGAALVSAGALGLTGCSALSLNVGPDVDAVDFGTVAQPTPINAVLALGEPASVLRADTNGDEHTVLVSVLEITEGDPEIYEQWENPEVFAGTTPYYLVIQTTYDTDDRELQSAPAIFPVSDTGQTTEFVVNTLTAGSDFATGVADCPVNLPDYDSDTNTELSCIIGLAPEGETIVGGLFNGEGYINNFDIGLGGGDPVYGPGPIQWSSDAVAGSVQLDAEAIDLGAPSVTAPGTVVGLGQPAWLPLPDDTSTVVGVSVLDIIPGDATFFDRYPNASDFEGFTPSFIVVQLQYQDSATALDRALPALHPLGSDGEYAQWMTDSTDSSIMTSRPGLLECGLVLPLYDPETLTFIGCITALTTDGAPVTTVEYDGESYTATWANDELGYFSNPVLFR